MSAVLLWRLAPWALAGVLALGCWGLWQWGERQADRVAQVEAALEEAVAANEATLAARAQELDQARADLEAADMACTRRLTIVRRSATAAACIREVPIDATETDVAPVLRDTFERLRRQ